MARTRKVIVEDDPTTPEDETVYEPEPAPEPPINDRLGILRNDVSRASELPKSATVNLYPGPEGTGSTILKFTEAGNGGHEFGLIATGTDGKRQDYGVLAFDGSDFVMEIPYPIARVHLLNRLEGAGRQDIYIDASTEPPPIDPPPIEPPPEGETK